MGINGPADVFAIEACREIESGRGRVITGTFTTAKCKVLQLCVSGEEKPLEPTPPHRFYSLDRGDYIAAEKLAVGERLVTRAGEVATVESIGMKPSLHRVYNLEVEGEHHYFVGESGVLVHNAYEDGVTGIGKLSGQGNDTSRATILEDAGVSPLIVSLPKYGGIRGRATSGTLVTNSGEAYLRSGAGPGESFCVLPAAVKNL